MMTKQEIIMDTLEKMGYSPKLDEDGDILIYHQMKAIYLMMADEDEDYVSMLLPQFYEIDEGKEVLALTVCNKMTRELKVAKVYIDRSFRNVTCACEFNFTNEESLQLNLANSLRIFGIIRTLFREEYAEMQED